MAEEFGSMDFLVKLNIDDSIIQDNDIADKMSKLGKESKAAFTRAFTGEDALYGYGDTFDFLGQYAATMAREFSGTANRALNIRKTYYDESKSDIISSLQAREMRSEYEGALRSLKNEFTNIQNIKGIAGAFMSGFTDILSNPQTRKMLELSVKGLTDETIKHVNSYKAGNYTSGQIVSYLSGVQGGAFNSLVANMTNAGVSKDRAIQTAQAWSNLVVNSKTPSFRLGMPSASEIKTMSFFRNFGSMIPQELQSEYKNYDANSKQLKDYKAFVKSADRAVRSGDLDRIERRLQNDAYLLNAMQQLGLATTRNGKSYLRNGLTVRDLNALSGRLLEETVEAGIGMKMYGITSASQLESQGYSDRAIRKNNKRLVNFRDAMSFISDIGREYESDYAPMRLNNAAIATMRADNANRSERAAFNTPYADLRRRYEAPFYTLNDLKNNKDWTKEVDPNYDDFRKYHHQAIDESILVRQVLKKTGKADLRNNQMLNDIMLLKFPENYLDMTSSEQVQARREFANYINNGIRFERNGKPVDYVFATANKNGEATFIPKNVFNEIEKEKPGFFFGGVNRKGRYGYSELSGILEHSNKINTGSYDIGAAYGADLSQLNSENVFIVNGKELTGLDGSSYISTRLIPGANQARGFNIKNVLTGIDFGRTQDFYANGTDGIVANQGIPIPLTGGGVGFVNKNTMLTLSRDDIKDFDSRFWDKSKNTWKKGWNYNRMLNEVLSDIKLGGIASVREVDEAEKTLNFIPGQSAGMLNMSAEDTMANVQRYIDVIDAVNTVNGAIKYVFGAESNEAMTLKKSPELLKTREYQSKVDEFIDSIYTHAQKNDFLVPEILNAKSRMALPFPVDFFNGMIAAYNETQEDANKINIPEIAKQLQLGDNNVFAPGMSGKLNLNRSPSALGSWVIANNILDNDNVRQYLKKSGRSITDLFGITDKGVYVGTGSMLLDMLQGADFDGDMLSVISTELDDIQKKQKLTKDQRQEIQSFKSMMERTVASHNAIFQQAYDYEKRNGSFSEDQLKKLDGLSGTALAKVQRKQLLDLYDERHTKQVTDLPESLRGNISPTAMGEAVAYQMALAQQGKLNMGSPNWVGVNAFNLGALTDEDAVALVQAIRHYDVNSTTAKKLQYFETTANEMRLLGKKNTPRLFGYIKNSKDEFGNIDPAKIKKNISVSDMMAMGAPSLDASGAYISSEITRTLLGSAFGSTGYEDVANTIVNNANGREHIKPDTAIGKLQLAMLELSRNRLAGKFISLSDKTFNDLTDLYNQADAEDRANHNGKNTREFGKIAAAYGEWQKSHARGQMEDIKQRADQVNAAAGAEVFYDSLDLKSVLQQNYAGDKALYTAQRNPFELHSSRYNWERLSQEARKNIMNGLMAEDGTTGKPFHWSFSSMFGLASEYGDVGDWINNWLFGQRSPQSQAQLAGDAAEAAISAYYNAGGAKSHEAAAAAALAQLDESYKKLDTKDPRYQANKDFISKVLPNVLPGMNYAMSKAKLRLSGIENEDSSKGEADYVFTDADGNVWIGDAKNYYGGIDEDASKLHRLQIGGYANGRFLYDDRWEQIRKQQLGDKYTELTKGDYYTIADMGLRYGGGFTINPTVQDAASAVRFYSANGEELAKIGDQYKQAQEAILKATTGESSTYEDLQKAAIEIKQIAGILTPENAEKAMAAIGKNEFSYTKNTEEGSAGSFNPDNITSALRANKAIETAYDMIGGVSKRLHRETGMGPYYRTWGDELKTLQDQMTILEAAKEVNGEEATKAAMDDAQRQIDLINKQRPGLVMSQLQDVATSMSGITNGTHEIKGISEITSQFDAMRMAIGNATKEYAELKNSLEQQPKMQTLRKLEKEFQEATDAFTEKYPKGKRKGKQYQEDKQHLLDLTNQYYDLRKDVGSAYDTSSKLDEQYALTQQAYANAKDITAAKLHDSIANEYMKTTHGISNKTPEQMLNDYKANILSIKQTIEANKDKLDDATYKNQIKFATEQEKILLSDKNLDAQLGIFTRQYNSSTLANELEFAKVLSPESAQEYVASIERGRFEDKLRERKAAVLRKATRNGKNLEAAQIEGILNGTDHKFYSIKNLSELEHQILNYSMYDYDAALAQNKEKAETLRGYDRQLWKADLQRREDAYTKSLHQRLHPRANVRGILAQSYQQIYNNREFLANEQTKYEQAIQDNKIMQEKFIAQNGPADKLQGDKAEQFAKLQAQGQSYANTLAKISAEQKTFNSTGQFVSATLNGINSSIGSLISRFSNRIFMTVINNIKNFVKQYEASLTEIQMITLKSDDEMKQVSSNTMSIARSLKTNALEVSQVESGLYRQGLSDEQVSERTAAVIKLSKVSGIKTNTASKIITTALQNGLVDDAEEAIDVLAALGDSAATTADEIQKALQKTAASASNAGVSYQELTAILTAAISKTQLSGNVVGTAFSTIMTRMRKISESGYVKGENGDVTHVNEVTSALSRVGVKVFDGDKMRSVVDILSDLAEVWNSIDDDKIKQNIIYSMAGRGANATNTLYSILDAMGEDKEFLRYLGIANNANGTVNQKYDIYANDFVGSLEDMKGAFQEWTNGVTDSGFIQWLVEAASSIMRVQGSLGGLGNAIELLVSWILASTVKTSLTNVATSIAGVGGALLSTVAPIAGLVAGLVVPSIVGGIQSAINARHEREAYNAALPQAQKEMALDLQNRMYGKDIDNLTSMKSLLEDFSDTYATFDELKKSQDYSSFEQSLKSLGKVFGTDFADKVEAACNKVNGFSEALKLVQGKINELNSSKTLNQIALEWAQGYNSTTEGKLAKKMAAATSHNFAGEDYTGSYEDLVLGLVFDRVMKEMFGENAHIAQIELPQGSDHYRVTVNTGTKNEEGQDITYTAVLDPYKLSPYGDNGRSLLQTEDQYNKYVESQIDAGYKYFDSMKYRHEVGTLPKPIANDITQRFIYRKGVWSDFSVVYDAIQDIINQILPLENENIYIDAAIDELKNYGLEFKDDSDGYKLPTLSSDNATGALVKEYIKTFFYGQNDLIAFLEDQEQNVEDVFNDFYDYFLYVAQDYPNIGLTTTMTDYFSKNNEAGYYSKYSLDKLKDQQKGSTYRFVTSTEQGKPVELFNFVDEDGIVTSDEVKKAFVTNYNKTKEQKQSLDSYNAYLKTMALIRQREDRAQRIANVNQKQRTYNEFIANNPVPEFDDFYDAALSEAENAETAMLYEGYDEYLRNEKSYSEQTEAKQTELTTTTNEAKQLAKELVTYITRRRRTYTPTEDQYGYYINYFNSEAQELIRQIPTYTRDYAGEQEENKTAIDWFVSALMGNGLFLDEMYSSFKNETAEAATPYDAEIKKAEALIAKINKQQDIANSTILKQQDNANGIAANQGTIELKQATLSGIYQKRIDTIATDVIKQLTTDLLGFGIEVAEGDLDFLTGDNVIQAAEQYINGLKNQTSELPGQIESMISQIAAEQAESDSANAAYMFYSSYADAIQNVQTRENDVRTRFSGVTSVGDKISDIESQIAEIDQLFTTEQTSYQALLTAEQTMNEAKDAYMQQVTAEKSAQNSTPSATPSNSGKISTAPLTYDGELVLTYEDYAALKNGEYTLDKYRGRAIGALGSREAEEKERQDKIAELKNEIYYANHWFEYTDYYKTQKSGLDKMTDEQLLAKFGYTRKQALKEIAERAKKLYPETAPSEDDVAKMKVDLATLQQEPLKYDVQYDNINDLFDKALAGDTGAQQEVMDMLTSQGERDYWWHEYTIRPKGGKTTETLHAEWLDASANYNAAKATHDSDVKAIEGLGERRDLLSSELTLWQSLSDAGITSFDEGFLSALNEDQIKQLETASGISGIWDAVNAYNMLKQSGITAGYDISNNNALNLKSQYQTRYEQSQTRLAGLKEQLEAYELELSQAENQTQLAEEAIFGRNGAITKVNTINQNWNMENAYTIGKLKDDIDALQQENKALGQIVYKNPWELEQGVEGYEEFIYTSLEDAEDRLQKLEIARDNYLKKLAQQKYNDFLAGKGEKTIQEIAEEMIYGVTTEEQAKQLEEKYGVSGVWDVMQKYNELNNLDAQLFNEEYKTSKLNELYELIKPFVESVADQLFLEDEDAQRWITDMEDKIDQAETTDELLAVFDDVSSEYLNNIDIYMRLLDKIDNIKALSGELTILQQSSKNNKAAFVGTVQKALLTNALSTWNAENTQLRSDIDTAKSMLIGGLSTNADDIKRELKELNLLSNKQQADIPSYVSSTPSKNVSFAGVNGERASTIRWSAGQFIHAAGFNTAEEYEQYLEEMLALYEDVYDPTTGKFNLNLLSKLVGDDGKSPYESLEYQFADLSNLQRDRDLSRALYIAHTTDATEYDEQMAALSKEVNLDKLLSSDEYKAANSPEKRRDFWYQQIVGLTPENKNKAFRETNTKYKSYLRDWNAAKEQQDASLLSADFVETMIQTLPNDLGKSFNADTLQWGDIAQYTDLIDKQLQKQYETNVSDELGSYVDQLFTGVYVDWLQTHKNGTVGEFIEEHKNDYIGQEVQRLNQEFGVGIIAAHDVAHGTYLTTSDAELTPGEYENILHKKMATPEQMKAYADQYKAHAQIGATALDNWIAANGSKGVQEYLQKYYPELVEYYNLDEAGRLSDYGENLKRKIDIQFAVSGLSDMEEAGKVLSGITKQVESLMQSSDIDAFNGLREIADSFESNMVAIDLYRRASNGEALTSEQWKAMGAPIEVSDMSQYISGERSLSDLDKQFAALKEQTTQSVNETYNRVLAFEKDNGGGKTPRAEWLKQYYNSIGYVQDEQGNFVYAPEQAEKVRQNVGSQSLTDVLRGRLVANENTLDVYDTEAYARSAYAIAKGATDWTGLANELDKDENKKYQEYIKSLITSGALDNIAAIENDNVVIKDYDAFLNKLFSAGYGINYKRYDLSNGNITGNINSILGGTFKQEDYRALKGKEDGEQQIEAIQKYLGSYGEEIMHTIATGGTVDQSILDKAAEEYSLLNIQERLRLSKYSSEAEQLYNTYANGTDIAKAQANRSYGQQAIAAAQNMWALDQLIGGNMDEGIMSTVMSFSGYNEKQIRQKLKTEEGKKELFDIANETFESIKNPILDTIKAMTDLDFSNLNIDQMREKAATASEDVQDTVNSLIDIFEMFSIAGTSTYLSFEEQLDKEYSNKYANNQLLYDIYKGNKTWTDIRGLDDRDYSSFIQQYGPLAYAMQNDSTNTELIHGFAETAMFGGNNMEANEYLMDKVLGEDWSTATDLQERFATAQTGTNAPYFEYLLQQFPELNDVMRSFNDTSINTEDAIRRVFDAMREAEYAEKYGEDFKYASEYVEELNKNARSAAQAASGLITKMNGISYSNKMLISAKDKSGAQLSKDQREALEGLTGIDENILKHYNAKDLAKVLEPFKAALQESWDAEIVAPLIESANDIFSTRLSETMQDNLQNEVIDLKLKPDVNGNIDLSALADVLDRYVNGWGDMFRKYAETGGTLAAEMLETDNAISYLFNFIPGKAGIGTNGFKTNKRSGGGGKSKTQKYLDNWAKKFAVYDHEIKMIQYQETKYKNAGQLSNYGAMVELENQAQKRYIANLKSGINGIKNQMKTLKKGSDDWYAAREAIMKYEEQIQAANQAILDNNRLLKENQQAIYKTRTDLEDTVRAEADKREKTRRDKLSATVSMEQTILEAIRKRYQDEWDLIKRDIDRKRNALEEEKNLINERLQARKDAEQEAEKYEQLAEYQRQLAYVSMDPTRTKDALELQHKIDELQKELAWNTAEKEAKAQQEAIDDQIQAYDQFTQVGDENLAAYLEDANNFADEVTTVLTSKHDELMAWLKANVEEYALALDVEQQNMLENWDDTFEAMYNITETWWTLINKTLTTKTSFLNYMKQSDEYKNATPEMRQQLLYQWGELYNDYTNAHKTGATYSHTDNFPSGTSTTSTKTTTTTTNTPSNGNGGNGNGGGKQDQPDQPDTPIVIQIGGGQQDKQLKQEIIESVTSVNDKAPLLRGEHGYSFVVNKTRYQKAGYSSEQEATKAAQSHINSIIAEQHLTEIYRQQANATLTAYKRGGLADYTGLAWVDGSKTRPEAFLSADDTKLMRGFLNAAKYVSVCATMSTIPDEGFGSGTTQTIDSVNITINEATINDDMDIQELAEKIGDSFIKELSINGINSSKYSY